MRSLAIEVGNTANLTCSGFGVGDGDYLWFYEKRNHLPRTYPISKGNILVLHNVGLINSGYYYCTQLKPGKRRTLLSVLELRIWRRLRPYLRIH